MKYTSNYNLKKPEGSDVVNIEDLNDNADIIDQALKAHDDALATKETPSGAQAKANAALDSAKAYTDQEVAEVSQALDAHKTAAAPHSGHETPAGAQAKADAAEANAKGYTNTHAGTKNTHGVGSGYYIAKTSRSDQLPAWSDVQGKPSNFTPSAHKSTHASGGSDALTPSDIGAETPAGAQAKAEAAAGVVRADIASQSVGKGADMIGLPDPNNIFTATTVRGALEELFTSVSNGKTLIAGAITDKGVPTSPSDTFATMANNISQLAMLEFYEALVAESANYGGAIYAIAVDENYVYVGGSTQTVWKLNKSDLSKVAESANYGANIYTIAVDENYVYVGGSTTQTVWKLNKSNLSKVAESANYGGIIRTIAVDENYVYVGGATSQTVWKLNKSNLSKVAESAKYGGTIYAMAADENYVYAGGFTTKTVWKLNKSNLSKVAESPNYDANIYTIKVDENYVYIGGSTTQTVWKLNKSDLSKVKESIAYGGTIYAIAVDENYVYVVGNTKTVWKLNKSDLSKVKESADYGGGIYAMAADENYVYVGGGTTYTVWKLNNLLITYYKYDDLTLIPLEV